MLLALIGSTWAQEVLTKTLPASMPELRVVAPHSRVTLRSDPGASQTVVHATPVRWSEGCSLDLSGDASQAVATVTLPERSAAHCRTDLEIILAGVTEVVLELDRGRVTLEAPQAPVVVELGTGRVSGQLASAGGRFEVDRGHVDLWGLRDPVAVDVGVGGVLVQLEEALVGTVDARVGVGRVRVRYPYGTWLDKDVEAVGGRVWTAIPSRSTSPSRLQARAGLGSVRIETVLTDEVAAEVASSD